MDLLFWAIVDIMHLTFDVCDINKLHVDIKKIHVDMLAAR